MKSISEEREEMALLCRDLMRFITACKVIFQILGEGALGESALTW